MKKEEKEEKFKKERNKVKRGRVSEQNMYQ